MPSIQTSVQPGDSASESQGARGLRTAKLSPISGNVSGAVAEHPPPVQSAGHSHPYSTMSADDYNVEPTGTLGLTSAELVLVGNEFIITPIHRGLHRDERLFTSSISRPTLFTVEHEQESDRTDLNLRCQEMLDNVDPCRSGESIPHAETTSYDCKGPGNLKRPRKALAFRLDKTGSLVRMPSFCQCSCSRCQQMVIPADTGDQDSATRKPIPYGEGSRDVTDVLTLTDVPTRPPMYDATGAEKLGVEMSCPSEASSQAVEMSCPSEASSQDAAMSCPSEASSQDVRPVVSTADAMLLSQAVSTADAMLLILNPDEREPERSVTLPPMCPDPLPPPRPPPLPLHLPFLRLCNGEMVSRQLLCTDAAISIEQSTYAFSNVLNLKREPYAPYGFEFPDHLDDGQYFSDDQNPADNPAQWHGKKSNRLLSVTRGLCIPNHTLPCKRVCGRETEGEKDRIPCLFPPKDKLLHERPGFENDIDDILDMARGKDTEIPKTVPMTRTLLSPRKLEKRLQLFASAAGVVRSNRLLYRDRKSLACENIVAASRIHERECQHHFNRVAEIRNLLNKLNQTFELNFALSKTGRLLDTPNRRSGTPSWAAPLVGKFNTYFLRGTDVVTFHLVRRCCLMCLNSTTRTLKGSTRCRSTIELNMPTHCLKSLRTAS